MPVCSYQGAIAAGAAAQAYAITVTQLPGGPPLAYWRLGSTHSVTDAVGGRNGIWRTTGGALVAGLPLGSDGAVDFKGISTAEVPHDAGLELEAFSLSFWVQPNVVPGEGEPDQPLFSKDNPTGNTANNVDGDCVIAIDNEGVFFVRFRRAGASNQNVTTPTGIGQVGQKYHIVVRADNTGFDLWINGVLYGKNTNYTGAWSSNQRNIQLAEDSFFAQNGNCILDEIAIYDRVLSEAEIAALAQITGDPVAEDDSASVTENQTTTINVVENDTFFGSKQDLTVTIVAQPTGGDEVAANEDNDIEYTAGDVDGETDRTFTYKIEDALGESNVATVRVRVQPVVTAPPSSEPAANCYDFTTGDTVIVSSMSALQNAVNNAPSGGRQVLIASGTYTGGSLTFTRSGGNPVVVRPRDGRGTVTINAARWTLATGSSWLIFNGLYFNDPGFSVNGSHHRATRCRIRQIRRVCFHLFDATDIRIDHCDVAEYIDQEGAKAFIRLRHTNVGNGSCKRVLIDHNYCHDVVTVQDTSNGRDFIGLSASTSNAAFSDPEMIVHRNYFTNINLPGEGELIGAKCSGVKFQYNTVINTGSACYINGPRQARNFEARSNWFENTRNRVLMIRSDNGVAIGNRFIGSIDLPVEAGDFYFPATGPNLPNGYPAARNCRIIGNRLGSGHILVGYNADRGQPALNTLLWGNTRDSGGNAHSLVSGGHSGTTTNVEDDEDYEPAVKLSPSDVGMAAPDPLCPSGPQS